MEENNQSDLTNNLGASPPNPSPQPQPSQPIQQNIPPQPQQPQQPQSPEPVIAPQTQPVENPVASPQPQTEAVQFQPTVTQSPQAVMPEANPQINSAQPQVSQSAMPASPPEMPQKKRSGKSKLLLPIIGIAVLLFGGVAAAYNTFVLNSPGGLWSTALSRTSGGFEEVLANALEEPAKGGSVEGSFKVESPTVVDGNIKGSWYESNVKLEGDIGVLGIRPKAEIRALPANEGQSPDIYIQLSDLSGIESLLGLGNPYLGELIAEINGSWYVIDHTLYEQALAGGSESEVPELTAEEISQISDAVVAVLNERLFTDDEAKAAVIVDEAIGEEDFDGVATYKYKLKVQKQQLKDLAVALKDALKETSANELIMSGSGADSFEEAIDFDSLLEQIEDTDLTNATAEAWVDKKLKFIRNIRIMPDSELKDTETGYIDFYLPYDGGDVFPFTINLKYEDTESEEKTDFSAVMAVNKETDEANLSLNLNSNMDGQSIVAQAKLNVTPSDNPIEVEKPAGAKNIYELLGLALGGGSLPTDTFPSDTLGDVDIRDLFGNPLEDSIIDDVELR